MDIFILLAFIFFGCLVAFRLLKGDAWRQKLYQYKRKDFFMTRAEHQCYDALIAVVGQKYHIFAQVNLPSVVNHQVPKQSWQAAFRHISQKSVDFVLCDKDYISPKLAIELDDITHERFDRVARDREVERILKMAGLPLLRLQNHGHFDPKDILQKINTALNTELHA